MRDRAGEVWVDVLDDLFVVLSSTRIDGATRHRGLMLDGMHAGRFGNIEERDEMSFETHPYMRRVT